MAIKVYKPTTNARRNMSVTDYSVLSKVAPEKSLLAPLNKKAGRNSYGRITVRHRGGGNRRKYRIIDFKRQKFDVPATVKSLEYDPNRSAFIALVEYEDGVKSYIVAPNGLKVGDKVVAGESADIKPGNALPLANIPTGTFIHNVELYPGRGAQLARAAGNMAQLMAKENGMALLRLPSGELRNVPVKCMATVGQVSNIEQDHRHQRIAANAEYLFHIALSLEQRAAQPVGNRPQQHNTHRADQFNQRIVLTEVSPAVHKAAVHCLQHRGHKEYCQKYDCNWNGA